MKFYLLFFAAVLPSLLFAQEEVVSEFNSDAPIFIKSKTLELDSKTNKFTYKGDVEISQDDTLITADEVVGKYNESNQLDLITCRNNVVITKGETLRASSNRAVYTVPDSTVVLTESPEVLNKGSLLSADKITVFLDEERSEAEGNVRVKVLQEEGFSPLELQSE